MATDNTANSIANNLIDPTNYIQGGGVVNDKLGFENTPEDWVMYVQLFVKPRNRSVLLKNNEGQIMASDNQEIKIADIPYYKRTIDKSDSGNIIPFDVQTTEYTDLFGAKGLPMTKDGTPNTLGQEAAFNISSINIDFNDVRQPTIDINFVDVRGAGLASYGPTGGVTKSPYSWFFLFPYPEFCLKVKGFYGKTISIPCLLHKFDMKYNNTTGNFDITTKFVGYPFSVLNDINVKILERMCCIPGGPEELENTYNKLINCLDPTNPDDKIILEEMPRIEDLCIKDYIRAIEEKKIDNPIQRSYIYATQTSDDLVVQYTNLIKKLNEILGSVRDNGMPRPDLLRGNFNSFLIDCKKLENTFQMVFNTPSNKETDDKKYVGLGGNSVDRAVFGTTANDGTSIPIKNFSDYTSDNKLKPENFSVISIDTSKSYFDPCASEDKSTAELDFKNGVNKSLKDTQTDITKMSDIVDSNVTKDVFNNAMNSGSVINGVEKSLLILRDQYQERLKFIQNYQSYLCNFFQTIEKRIKKEFPETLRVRPSLQRLFTMIAINVEAFLNLLLKTSIQAEKYHEDHKENAAYANYFTDASNQQFVDRKGSTNNRGASLRGVKLYAWPKTYKFNGNGEKEEVFPSELNDDFNDWPEVKFTKNVIDSIASNNCDSDKLIGTTGGGLSKWKSLNIFEDAPFVINKPNNSNARPLDSPYNNHIFTQYVASPMESADATIQEREEKLKQLIVSRALINLFYFNRLFEQDINVSNSMKTIYDGYVKSLAQRDADNLITTMENCNLLEVIAQKFGSDAGLILLTEFTQKSTTLNFVDGLEYQDQDLTIPYGMSFYLGNNNTNIKVTDTLTQLTYQRPRSSNDNFLNILYNNYYGLTFYDKPLYPFTRYITVYLNNGDIISGFEYAYDYKSSVLNVSSNQNVIYNYCPFYQPVVGSAITPPLGIQISTITNQDIPHNIFYNLVDVQRVVVYNTFLNPSHIRDVATFSVDDITKIPSEQPQTLSPDDPNNLKLITGNGLPTWSNLFDVLKPVPKTTIPTYQPYLIGIDAFNTYKSISSTKIKSDGKRLNSYHPTNLYDEKTYYHGAEDLLTSLSNTIRVYHTTYNHYSSDILKSFLWDPCKTKIGNPSTNQLGTQEKSVYNIIKNLDKPELQSFNITDDSGSILTNLPTGSVPFTEDWTAGSYWGTKNVNGAANTGFQNTIFYSSNKLVNHKYLNQQLPIFYHLHQFDTLDNAPSLIQYLFVGDQGGNTSSIIPLNSKWLKEFGTISPVGIDYNGNTFTISNMFAGQSPFENTGKYFTNYSKFIVDKGLDSHSLYDIPVDMNSTWFRGILKGRSVTPVKKYQTTYMKKLSYLIWKEATMRVLSMCEVNLLNGKDGIVGGQYYTDNVSDYVSVQLIDDPAMRPGGPTTATTQSLFDGTYPQSKFHNRNIDIYNGNVNYKFYDQFINDTSGTYILDPPNTFNEIYPGQDQNPVNLNPYYPTDNPTDDVVLSSPTAQPPLVTSPLFEYTGTSIQTPKWTRMFIHQTDWWKNMTSDPRLTSSSAIDEVGAMKTYLTLMSLWGGNSMDDLIYNYPLMSPASGLFRTNNIDLLTLGAFLWAQGGKLYGTGDPIKNVINDYLDFSCPILNNSTLLLKFGDPDTTFPFNVIFKDTNFNYTMNGQELDRWVDYGVICSPATTTNLKWGETMLTNPATISNEQTWVMKWELKSTTSPDTYNIQPKNLSPDVKRDLIDNFLQFVETSEFVKNIDENLQSLSTLREVAEIALESVESNIGEGDKVYHRFPFDIEQTLLMWGDWASIVDLSEATKEFKSYYDADDGWRVKRPEQKTILSTKLFDVLTKESADGTFDHPYKEIKTTLIGPDVYYYSPWVRVGFKNGYQNELLALKGNVGKKILLKLMKVITYDEQSVAAAAFPIITKRNGKFESQLNYKLRSRGSTLPGNDQNYFFEHLFKGFYFNTIYGGMVTNTDRNSYDAGGLGGHKLFFSKSWRDCEIANVSDLNGINNIVSNIIPNSDRLQTYFKTFCASMANITKGNDLYDGCKKNNKPELSQNHNVDLGKDSLPYYRTFKNLFNRWLAGSTEDNHTYKRSGCAAIVGGSNECRSLIQNIHIVDRVNRPAGHLVFGDPNQFKDFFNTNPERSVMTFLAEFVDKAIGGFMVEYPTFFNFGNSGLNLDENPGQAMWGMTTNIDEKYGGPAIVVYVQRSNQSAANSSLNDYVNEDMNEYKSADSYAGNKVLPEDFKTPDSRGVIFKVAIGNENNNIFTGLQIDTQEFKETYEHIQVLDQIAKEVNSGNPKFIDQNLYNLWNVRSFTANIECFGNMLIQPGMFFWLENVPIFGGTYIIKKVTHAIEPHNIKTKFWGSRINNIPAPYAGHNAIGSYYRCNAVDVVSEPDVIQNDPGYCKDTMTEILSAFVNEVERVLGVKPIVYTSDDFLTKLGFTEDDSKSFYNNYDVAIQKNGTDSPFGNVQSINVTQDEFSDEFIASNFPSELPQGELSGVTGNFVVPVTGRVGDKVNSANLPGYQSGPRIHEGIDIITGAEGTPVYASADGDIIEIHDVVNRDRNASDGGGYGNYIRIRHIIDGNVYVTTYNHLRKGSPHVAGISIVAPNNHVTRGQLIGYVGDTGHSVGYHLHFEIWRNNWKGQLLKPEQFIPQFNNPTVQALT